MNNPNPPYIKLMGFTMKAVSTACATITMIARGVNCFGPNLPSYALRCKHIGGGRSKMDILMRERFAKRVGKIGGLEPPVGP